MLADSGCCHYLFSLSSQPHCFLLTELFFAQSPKKISHHNHTLFAQSPRLHSLYFSSAPHERPSIVRFVPYPGQSAAGQDIEMGMNPLTNSGELGLEKFFKQVKEIEQQYDKLDKLLITLQEAHEESKAVTKAASMKAIKRRMEKDVDEVGKVALGMKSMIEAIDRDGTAVDRARTATTISVKRKLKDKMSEFQTLRQNIHQEYREVVERRIFTVTGTRADEETIEQLIETGDSKHIFQKAIQEQGRGQIMDTLAEIQERHDAVREVEKKLLDLQQILLDMAVLVEAQGDLLDNIESQVSTAVDHVQSGNTALQRAKSMQKNSRKWMCIGILILLIIVCIIVVTVIKPWKNKGA